MPEIASISTLADRYQSSIRPAQEDYEYGVQNNRRDWSDEVGEGSTLDAFTDGLAFARAHNLYSKGINRVGQTKWENRTLNVGIQAYRDAYARPETRTNVAEALSRLMSELDEIEPLPERLAPVNTQNVAANCHQRSWPVALHLHEASEEGPWVPAGA